MSLPALSGKRTLLNISLLLSGAPSTKILQNTVYSWAHKSSGMGTIKAIYASGDIPLYNNKCYVICNHANFHLRTSNYSYCWGWTLVFWLMVALPLLQHPPQKRQIVGFSWGKKKSHKQTVRSTFRFCRAGCYFPWFQMASSKPHEINLFLFHSLTVSLQL